MAITVCRPLVIGIGARAVSEPVSMISSVPQAARVHPAGCAAGVPATNRLVPLSNPIRAAETGIAVEKTGLVGLLKFTFTTLGATDPPQPEPQFRIKAVVSFVSLGSKTPIYGWLPVGKGMAVACLLLALMTKKALVLGI